VRAILNCTDYATSTVGRFRRLCICAGVVLLTIIASSFCQMVNFWLIPFSGELHERIQARIDVIVLDALY
jgi:hypothetical protein